MVAVAEQELTRWAHQVAAVKEVFAARAAGHRVIVLTSPTGSGKSVMMMDMIDLCLDRSEKVVLYTNRKLLTSQTQRVMHKHGIRHGIRAAGWEPNLKADVQISSIQTENSRVMKRGQRALHDAQMVLVDEGHLNKAEMAQAIYKRHLEDGATIVLVTATPIDMGNIAGHKPHLVVAGKTRQLINQKILVPAEHYGPDEPDTRKIRKQPWEFTENDVRKLIMVQGIFARVVEWFKRLNPEQRPSLLFAPGVPESIWFAEQFTAAGIRAAHIDGKECWLDGELVSGTDIRDTIIAGSKNGSIKVICNRFVLREGIDLPWLEHGIFATVFGSLQSYIQSGGRLLRAYPGKTRAIIQDHGGNWHRHGSLNADRVWHLDYTEAMHHGMREQALREKLAPEPFLCPKCGKVLQRSECGCGFVVTRKSRPVVQANGEIRQHTGDIYRPREVKLKWDTHKLWEACYYRARKSRNEMTFRQAEALFFYENGYYPPRDLPLMPVDGVTWYRKVKDVPRDNLS